VKKHLFYIAFLFVLASCGGSGNTVNTYTIEYRFEQAKKAYDNHDYMDAIRLFEEIRIQAPTSPFAIEAMYLGAMSRYKNENFLTAAVDFRNFRRNYPTSGLAPRSQFMVAESYYELSPNAPLDQTYTSYAITEYQYFLRMYGNDEGTLSDSCEMRILELRTKLAQKYLSAGELYLKLESRKSALAFFDRVLADYYDTTPAIEAQLRIAEIQLERGKLADSEKAILKFDESYLGKSTQQQRERARKIKQYLALK
jgi:outer membrane protein assembly factor BamD